MNSHKQCEEHKYTQLDAHLQRQMKNWAVRQTPPAYVRSRILKTVQAQGPVVRRRSTVAAWLRAASSDPHGHRQHEITFTQLWMYSFKPEMMTASKLIS